MKKIWWPSKPWQDTSITRDTWAKQIWTIFTNTKKIEKTPKETNWRKLDSTDSSTDYVSSDEEKIWNPRFTETVTTQVTTQRIYHQGKLYIVTENLESVSPVNPIVTESLEPVFIVNHVNHSKDTLIVTKSLESVSPANPMESYWNSGICTSSESG